MKYRHLPTVVEAITFDELVEHGRKQGVPCHGPLNLPWSFLYNGHPITHENDDCYLVNTLEGTVRFERGHLLITGIKGEIYPCRADIFAATYEPVES